MKLAIKLLTFIPWIIYFLHIMKVRTNTIEKNKYDKDKYFKYIDKNFFKSLSIKELLLFFVFILFLTYKNTTTLEILFAAIYIYLLIDILHDYDFAEIKNSKNYLIEIMVLIVGLIVYFILTNNLYTSYVLAFMVSILSSLLTYIFEWFRKLFKKKSNK